MFRKLRKTQSSLFDQQSLFGSSRSDITDRNSPQPNGENSMTRAQSFQNALALNSLSDANGDAEQQQAKPVTVYAYTYDPTIAWELLKPRQSVKSFKPLKSNTPIKPDLIRFVCISDLHGKHRAMVQKIPDGDVLVVAGDFTSVGHPEEIIDFNAFLATLPHRYKIVIAGNHELTFDPLQKRSNYMGFEKVFKHIDPKGFYERSSIEPALKESNITDVRQLMTNCFYLEDSEVVIYGIRIYGTPWQPAFDNWAFNLPRGKACLDKWNRIPADIDILLTHTPPIGHGDLTRNGVRAGCVELLNTIQNRVKPKFHVFGHIHEGYGCTTNGETRFINACICDIDMKPVNSPIIFDYPLPKGHSKN